MRIRHQHMRVAPLPPDPQERFRFEAPLEPADLPAILVGAEEIRRDIEQHIMDEILPPAQRIDTSLRAAAVIQPHTARIREAIWLWLKTQGSHGATDGEICAALDLNPSTERPRRRELEGTAPWAPKLPRRIQRLSTKRLGMRIYVVVAPRDSGNP